MATSLPANISDLAKGLTTYTQRAQDNGTSLFIRMDKTGTWIFGAEETIVEEGSLWAVNPHSFIAGFIAWEDNLPVGEEMRPVSAPPISMNELPDVGGAKWTEQLGFQMVCVQGEDEGTKVVYKVNSVGGRKAVRSLIDDVLSQANKGSADVVPIIELSSDSYKHQKYGRIYVPVLTVQKWKSLEDDHLEDEGDAPEPEEEQKEAPKKRTRRRS